VGRRQQDAIHVKYACYQKLMHSHSSGAAISHEIGLCR
jgi:hypothetical protein